MTGVGRQQRGQDPDGRGLAGAVRPEQPVDGPRRYLQAQPLEYALAAEALAQFSRADGGIGHCGTPRSLADGFSSPGGFRAQPVIVQLSRILTLKITRLKICRESVACQPPGGSRTMAGSARDRRRDCGHRPRGRRAPGGAARRRELIDAAAMAARLQQNAYDRFEDAVAGYFGVNRTAMRCLEVLDRLGQQTAGEIADPDRADQRRRHGDARPAGAGRAGAAAGRRFRPAAGAGPADRQGRAARRRVYGPLAGEMAEFERYTDDQLRLMAEFLRMATHTLERHAGRVEQQRRDR